MRIRIRIATTAADRLRTSRQHFREAIELWSRKAAAMVRDEMVRQIRSRQKSYGRTGQLSASVAFRLTGRGFTVAPTASYAVFVDQPTRPHVIRPRHGKVLAFPRSGARSGTRGGRRVSVFRHGGRETASSLVYARVVHHPGTRGMFFVHHTVQAVREPVRELLAGEVRAAIDRMGGGQ